MGKKKNRNRTDDDDDDDLVGGPLLTDEVVAADANDDDGSGTDAGPGPGPGPGAGTDAGTDAGGGFDLAAVRSEMKSLLAKFPEKPDDWLHRSIEKNLRLKKKSLKALGQDVLDEMRVEVEEELDEELADGEEGGEEEDAGEVGDAGGEDDGGETIDAATARARAEARIFGSGGVAAVAAAGEDGGDGDGDGPDGGVPPTDGGGDGGGDGIDTGGEIAPAPASGLASVLLALRPHVQHAAGGSGSIVSVLLSVVFRLLSLLASASTATWVEREWDRDAPRRRAEAERAAEEASRIEAEEDDELRNSHLWCPNSLKWVKRGETYSAPGGDDGGNDSNDSNLPATVRFGPGKRWERWSKNLTTKTKKSATGEPMTKGTWMPAKAGDGWSTAPGKAEVENKLVTDGDVRFLACLERSAGGTGAGSGEGDGGDVTTMKKKGAAAKKKKATIQLEVVDITDWATSALLTKESARALGAVDSGRVLFHLDVGPAADIGKGAGGGAWVDERYGGERKGGSSGGGGSGPSRAEKKAKKKNYGR